eukprot:TRINITY_DN7225_c0_g1_i1.p1 TRINITY_DN7225_c0_g1~~TRINITY_DN7225_c0_g1_i1.p1  ORF type:complete len:508 (+),score=113.30 TRINITY_DN7225_c0_g1_i1:157-1680(+)
MADTEDLSKIVRRHKKLRSMLDGDDSDAVFPKLFVEGLPLQMMVCSIVVINGILMAWEADAKAAGVGGNGVWLMLESVFHFIYACEIGLRLFVRGKEFFTCPVRGRWNTADFIIFALCTIEAMVVRPITGQADTRIVQILRFERLVSLVPFTKRNRALQELWLVCHGLFQSLLTLVWIIVLLLIVCYIGGTFLTFYVGLNDEGYGAYFMESGFDHEVYFGTVARSAFTLSQVLTLDTWNENIVRHVISQEPRLTAFFIAFVGFTSFGILNVICGVVVEKTLRSSSKTLDREKQRVEADQMQVMASLRAIFEEADADDSGSLSLDEVEKAIRKTTIYNMLKLINFPVDDPESLFNLLDFDDSGELTIDEFIDGCIRMKGFAKSKDLLVAQVALDAARRHLTISEAALGDLTSQIESLVETVKAIISQGEFVFLTSQEYRFRHPNYLKASLPCIDDKELEAAPWLQRASRLRRNTETSVEEEPAGAATMFFPGEVDDFSERGPPHPLLQ